jgi:hypothetical protein
MRALLDPVRQGPPLGEAVVLNRDSPQAAGLVGWWPALGSHGAGVLRDYTGRGYHGVWVTSGVSWAADPRAGALLAFAADTDRVDLEHGGALNLGFPFTVMCWARHSVTANSIILETNGNSGWSVQVGGGGTSTPGAVKMNCGFVADDYIVGDTATNDGAAHLLVFVARGTSDGSFYLDGRDDTLSANPATPSYSSVTAINLNARPAVGAGFAGQVGEVRIYNRALSAAEAWQLYDPATRWALYAPPRRLWLVPTGQFARPDADVTDGSWTNELGSATDLYASLDESTATDSDYIQSSVNPSSDVAEVALGNVSDPTVHTGHRVRYRIQRG